MASNGVRTAIAAGMGSEVMRMAACGALTETEAGTFFRKSDLQRILNRAQTQHLFTTQKLSQAFE